MSLGTDIISRTVTTQKLFAFEVGKCIYSNIETSMKNEKNQDEPIIKISNTVCKDTGSMLLKITQIRFKEKLIVIRDQYRFGGMVQSTSIGDRNSSHPTKSSDGSSHSNPLLSQVRETNRPAQKKKLIFKKKFLEEHSKVEKRNTKNIAKNFCKAFLNYLQEEKRVSTLDKAKEIMRDYNYNNKTIEIIGRDNQVRQSFGEFLRDRADVWVESSKVHDKKIHKQAISLYLSLISNKSEGKSGRKIEDMMEEEGVLMEQEDNNSGIQSDEIFQENNGSGGHNQHKNEQN